MRKVIAFVVLGALVSALLSSPAQALSYDPRNPGPDRMSSHLNSADDTGWIDEKTSIQYRIWSIFNSTTSFHDPVFFVIGLIVIPTTDVSRDDIGNYERNDTDTILEDTGPSSR